MPASPNTAWDWFHINAVHIDTDGNLLIDSRHTWTFYKVDRTSGVSFRSAISGLGFAYCDFTRRSTRADLYHRPVRVRDVRAEAVQRD